MHPAQHVKETMLAFTGLPLSIVQKRNDVFMDCVPQLSFSMRSATGSDGRSAGLACVGLSVSRDLLLCVPAPVERSIDGTVLASCPTMQVTNLLMQSPLPYLGVEMRFGVVLHLSSTYATWDDLLTIANEAERLGYDSIWVSDHLLSPRGRPHALEAWTVLSAFASSVPRVRLGTYVLCNQFRHPSMLAKMASTLDNISRGRLELGIGAGYLKNEHVAFGFDWGRHSVRIERLREALEIVRRLWTEDHASYVGAHFRIEDATLEPKPLQKPHPPIWVGGNSTKIMRIVAELGNGWIPVLPTPRQLAAGASEIRQGMKQAGRNPDTLQVAYGGSGCLLIARDKDTVKRMAEPLARSWGKRLEESACLIGTPEQCIQRIEQYQKAGAQAIVAGFYDFPSLDGMRLFAETVIPNFR